MSTPPPTSHSQPPLSPLRIVKLSNNNYYIHPQGIPTGGPSTSTAVQNTNFNNNPSTATTTTDIMNHSSSSPPPASTSSTSVASFTSASYLYPTGIINPPTSSSNSNSYYLGTPTSNSNSYYIGTPTPNSNSYYIGTPTSNSNSYYLGTPSNSITSYNSSSSTGSYNNATYSLPSATATSSATTANNSPPLSPRSSSLSSSLSLLPPPPSPPTYPPLTLPPIPKKRGRPVKPKIPTPVPIKSVAPKKAPKKKGQAKNSTVTTVVSASNSSSSASLHSLVNNLVSNPSYIYGQSPSSNSQLLSTIVNARKLLPSMSSSSSILNPVVQPIQTLSKLPPPPTSSVTPMPPNWNENMQDTVNSLSAYKLFPVDVGSPEYKTIEELLDPVDIIKVDQIVNPNLWNRFISTRKDMLCSKSDDISLLSKLGLDDSELLSCTHRALNWDKDPLLVTHFDENMVLLFHCTRQQTNINPILLQGLDERMAGISGGLLGKGIYFADNPRKSIQYDGGSKIIFIFGVLLGDCLSVDHLSNNGTLVREPEKANKQKRSHLDHFFDSIVARPAGDNEYVIYNRYQCCPLYQIQYGNTKTNKKHIRNGIDYKTSRNSLPSLAWKKDGFANPDGNWPYYASRIFRQMGVKQQADLDEEEKNRKEAEQEKAMQENFVMLRNLGFINDNLNRQVLEKYDGNLDRAVNFLLDQQNHPVQNNINIVPQQFTSTVNSRLVPSLTFPMIDLTTSSPPSSTMLNSNIQAGYPKSLLSNPSNNDDNRKKIKLESDEDILLKTTHDWFNHIDLNYFGNKNQSLPDLSQGGPIMGDTNLFDNFDIPLALDMDSDPEQPQQQVLVPVPAAPVMEECAICCNEFETSSPSWVVLSCSHKLCNVCYSQIEMTRTTMSGITHTSVRCPFCQGITGVEVGTCPIGVMNVTELTTARCSGYESYGTYCINYNIPSKGFHRTAYLPTSDEGKKVLNLLRTAWDRRLCFTVGTSVTTGAENTIVWNIHHKTSMKGGVQQYGYPDPGYFDRVKLELKSYGIE